MKAELEAGFGLKIVTSQLLCSLSTLTLHHPRLPFHLPLKENKAESASWL